MVRCIFIWLKLRRLKIRSRIDNHLGTRLIARIYFVFDKSYCVEDKRVTDFSFSDKITNLYNDHRNKSNKCTT